MWLHICSQNDASTTASYVASPNLTLRCWLLVSFSQGSSVSVDVSEDSIDYEEMIANRIREEFQFEVRDDCKVCSALNSCLAHALLSSRGIEPCTWGYGRTELSLVKFLCDKCPCANMTTERRSILSLSRSPRCTMSTSTTYCHGHRPGASVAAHASWLRIPTRLEFTRCVLLCGAQTVTPTHG